MVQTHSCISDLISAVKTHTHTQTLCKLKSPGQPVLVLRADQRVQPRVGATADAVGRRVSGWPDDAASEVHIVLNEPTWAVHPVEIDGTNLHMTQQREGEKVKKQTPSEVADNTVIKKCQEVKTSEETYRMNQRFTKCLCLWNNIWWYKHL